MRIVWSIVLCGLVSSCFAETPSTSWLEKGSLIVSDDFERSDLGEWKSIIPSFEIVDGHLKGFQSRDDHGAVGRIYAPMKDVIVEFQFQLVGSSGFVAVFDDKNFKGSHAGHICRVAFAPTAIRLGDDREGVMRNDIFEMRKDAAGKAQAEKLLVGRNAAAPFKLVQKQWYQAKIEMKGEELRASIDGKQLVALQSPGIGHPTKGSLHFTVNDSGVLFDDVKIWNVR